MTKSTARKTKPQHHEKPLHSARSRDTATANAMQNANRRHFNPIEKSDDVKFENRRYELKCRKYPLRFLRRPVGYSTAKPYFDDPDVQVTRVK